MEFEDYGQRILYGGQSSSRFDASAMDWEEINHVQDNNAQLSTLSGFKDYYKSPCNQSRNFFTGKTPCRNVSSPLSLLSSLKISDHQKPSGLGLFDDFYSKSEFQENNDSKMCQGPVIQHKTGWLSNGQDTCFYFQTTGVAYLRNCKPPLQDSSHVLSPMDVDSKMIKSSLDSTEDECRVSSPTKIIRADVSVSSVEDSPVKSRMTEHYQKINEGKQTLSQNGGSFIKSFKISVSLITTLLICLLFQLYIRRPAFHSNNGGCFDFKLLEENMRSEIYGQHIALGNIFTDLKAFLDSNGTILTLSMHGSCGTGKSFMVQHITSILPKDKFLYFPVAKTFPSTSVEANVEHLKQEFSEFTGSTIWSLLYGMDSICPYFVVVDNMDYATEDFVNELIKLMDEGNIDESKKIVFILLSNTGSDIINEIAFHALVDGRSTREEMGSDLFLKNISFVESLERSWPRRMLEMNIINRIVPFLPLQKQHVEMCARQRMQEKKAVLSEEMMNKVVSDVERYHQQSGGFFSALGCKKVSSKVDEIIYSNICKTNSGVSLLDSEMQQGFCEK